MLEPFNFYELDQVWRAAYQPVICFSTVTRSFYDHSRMESHSHDNDEEYLSQVSDHRLPSSEDETQQLLEKIRVEKGSLTADNVPDLARVPARTKRMMDLMASNYRKEQAKSTRKYAIPTSVSGSCSVLATRRPSRPACWTAD